jgi:hypothetical protein
VEFSGQTKISIDKIPSSQNAAKLRDRVLKIGRDIPSEQAYIFLTASVVMPTIETEKIVKKKDGMNTKEKS